MLPAKAKASLYPFEELSSKVLLTSKDLNKFLKRWEGLQLRIEELRAHLSREGEAARRSLDEMSELHTSIQPGSRIREWQEAYSRLRQSLPPKFHLSHVKFDALSNRPICSRQDLQKFWADTMRQLRGMRFWNIRPWKMTVAFIEDLALTVSFAFTFKNSKASSRE